MKIFSEDYKEQILIAVEVQSSVHGTMKEQFCIEKLNNIDDNMGTAVVIQEMAFGNFNEKSELELSFQEIHQVERMNFMENT